MNRDKAIQTLVENARKISIQYQSIVESFGGIVKAKKNNKEMFIPGYIPYIGEEYFEASTKIFIYALSQNLSPTDDISIKWAIKWRDGDKENYAINRQNINFKNHGKVMMQPFDTGHLPVIAGILNYLSNPTTQSNQNIYKSISATNLSKFSFRDGNKTTDNSESLKKCFRWFSIKEIELLQPDYIICAGDKVYDVVKDSLESTSGPHPSVIRVRFPSLLVINSKFKKMLKNDDDKRVKIILSIFSNSVLNKESSYRNRKSIREIIERDKNYFVAMFDCIKKQI
ncbi:hypothetical protein CEE37_13425 [candidate division LCP-89 bacterium B3_LCP]|uniref:Uracil-DNA glycosylase-like domain-containing protein n=1 Tax=candidate division LCP-89 bacterium B3_LCP TaxID=2012998 RepID=A0A532UT21_UNCL8|nr:MAG: hypothetical protein CEE37_13425 [candidate division LCP-89 bacterium B3_LCP]